MNERDIDDYSGPKVDAVPVSNPESQLGSTELNRLTEDVAQATKTIRRATCWFNTTAVAAPVTYNAVDVNVRSVWGSGTSQKPTVTKTATGRYTITWAVSYTDILLEVETLAFYEASGSAMSSTATDTVDVRVLTRAANSVTIGVYAAGALTDVGNVSAAVFEVSVRVA